MVDCYNILPILSLKRLRVWRKTGGPSLNGGKVPQRRKMNGRKMPPLVSIRLMSIVEKSQLDGEIPGDLDL
jgi:hypothetical protein